MLLSIINNPNAHMSIWQMFIEWFKSLYDINWNFFGRNFCLMDVLQWSFICVIVLDSFSTLFGFTQDIEENM